MLSLSPVLVFLLGCGLSLGTTTEQQHADAMATGNN